MSRQGRITIAASLAAVVIGAMTGCAAKKPARQDAMPVLPSAAPESVAYAPGPVAYSSPYLSPHAALPPAAFRHAPLEIGYDLPHRNDFQHATAVAQRLPAVTTPTARIAQAAQVADTPVPVRATPALPAVAPVSFQQEPVSFQQEGEQQPNEQPDPEQADEQQRVEAERQEEEEDDHDDLFDVGMDPLPELSGSERPGLRESDREFIQRRNTVPIDLANALRLGGASNLQIALAREKVVEADQEWRRRKFAMLPSIRYGLGFNKHDGRLQGAGGDVMEAERNSLFLGGGAGLGRASLAGGSNGPSRLVANLSIADAWFDPLVGRQLLEVQTAGESVVMNDELLAIAIAYFDLVEAYGLLANSRSGLDAARRMAEVTKALWGQGRGLASDVHRANVEEASWHRELQDARRLTIERSAELSRLLNLDPYTRLIPVEDIIAPIEIVDDDLGVRDMIATGLATRPEMAQYSALVEATLLRMRREKYRPWLPNVQVGASAGTFGGGKGTTFDNQGSRSDVDLLAYWELRNLGLGNVVERRRRSSQVRQAEIEAQIIQQRITTEVVTAAADVSSYRRQIESATRGIIAANSSFQTNLDRIRDGKGLPIELIQAVRARNSAQNDSTRAIANYNRAQYRLLRAIGRPPHPTAPTPIGEEGELIDPPQPLPEGG